MGVGRFHPRALHNLINAEYWPLPHKGSASKSDVTCPLSHEPGNKVALLSATAERKW